MAVSVLPKAGIAKILYAAFLAVIVVWFNLRLSYLDARTNHISSVSTPVGTNSSLPSFSGYRRDQNFLQLQPLFFNDSDFMVLSAFLDTRPLLEGSSPVVVVIGTARAAAVENGLKNLRCKIQTDDGEVLITPAGMERYGNGHGCPYDQVTLFRCRLPDKPERTWGAFTDSFESVTLIRTGRHANLGVSLPIQPTELHLSGNTPFDGNQDPRLVDSGCTRNSTDEKCHNFGICVAPIRGDRYADTINEFLDHYNRLAGAPSLVTFMIYNDSAGNATSRALKERRGLDRIQLIEWSVDHPSFPGMFNKLNGALWYNGQVMMMADCIYRLMGKVRWVGVMDLDEFVIGRCNGAARLVDIFQRAMGPHLHREQDGVSRTSSSPWPYSFSFRCAVFPLECIKTVAVDGILGHVWRSNYYGTRDRTKYFLDPLRVGIPAVHYVLSYTADDAKEPLVEVEVPTEIAAMHHYRGPDEGLAFNRKNCSEENSILDLAATALVVKPECPSRKEPL